MKTQHTGKHAEILAKEYLEKRGLVSITSNYSCRYGEIDLIMRDGASVIFIEVRFRSRQEYGGARESVDRRKQRKLVNTATHFLQSRHWLNHIARIDVLAINSLDGHDEDIEWIQDAFDA